MSYTILRDLSKLFLAILVCFFALPSDCFSTSLSINCDSAYAKGAITIQIRGVPAVPKYTYDTIKFSNGISLSFFSQYTNIPEPVLLNHGLSIDSSASFIKAGFKYSQSASWKQVPGDTSIYFYASNDTNWALSKNYPDSLMHLDSLYDGYGPRRRFKMGKWLYWTDGDLTFGEWGAKIPNFNNILYINAGRSKLKIQVSGIFFSGIFHSFQVDSLRLLWAVDSLGNGLFKQNVGIKNIKPEINDKKNIERSIKRGGMRDVNNLLNAGHSVVFFNSRGQRIGHLNGMKGADVPKGIIVCKTSTTRIFRIIVSGQ